MVEETPLRDLKNAAKTFWKQSHSLKLSCKLSIIKFGVTYWRDLPILSPYWNAAHSRPRGSIESRTSYQSRTCRTMPGENSRWGSSDDPFLWLAKVRFTAKKIDQFRKSGGCPWQEYHFGKDLFDVTGEITTAGSILLKESTPPKAMLHQLNVSRCGFDFNRSNQYDRICLLWSWSKRHYGTPRNPFDRKSGRIRVALIGRRDLCYW